MATLTQSKDKKEDSEANRERKSKAVSPEEKSSSKGEAKPAPMQKESSKDVAGTVGSPRRDSYAQSKKTTESEKKPKSGEDKKDKKDLEESGGARRESKDNGSGKPKEKPKVADKADKEEESGKEKKEPKKDGEKKDEKKKDGAAVKKDSTKEEESGKEKKAATDNGGKKEKKDKEKEKDGGDKKGEKEEKEDKKGIVGRTVGFVGRGARATGNAVKIGVMFPMKLFLPAKIEPEREEAAMNSPRRKKDVELDKERKEAREKAEKEEKESKDGDKDSENSKSEPKGKYSKDRTEDSTRDSESRERRGSYVVKRKQAGTDSTEESGEESSNAPPVPSFVTQVQRPGTKPNRPSKAKDKNEDSRDSKGVHSPRKSEKKNTKYGTKKAKQLKDLLPPQTKEQAGKKCLVLDLDETLVHSSFHEVEKYDFKLNIEIEKRMHTLYVAKRPYVDEFLEEMSKIYELVIFTASLAVYANAVMDLLDPKGTCPHRLFRDSCTQYKGAYIKDMGRMGRDMKKIMILDNSAHSYAFNPNLGVPCESWFDDYSDFELLTLMKVFEDLASEEVVDLAVELEKIFGAPEDVLAEIDADWENSEDN